MAQLEGNRRYTETPTPKTPKAQHSPAFEQPLQGDASWQSNTSPMLARNHDPEEDFSHHINRKSVLTRVKEKARKLRYSLSGKKKDDHDILDSHTTPSCGVSLEDNSDEEKDDDPEYLGAPMYESELAPEAYIESARQHPRADPVVSEKHLWPTSIKCEDEEKDKPAIHNKSITETVSEKLAPAYAAISDATHTIASKIAGLSISGPEGQQKQRDLGIEPHNADGAKNSCSNSEIREHLSNKSPQKWDTVVSVKEYFMNKLEPGEDDRALSQVISEAISPKKTPGDNMGMVEKVREAVTSLLQHEESSESAPKDSMGEFARMTAKTRNLSSNTPISTQAEVPPPNSTSSTNINSSSKVPISQGASFIEEPSKETIRSTNLSSVSPVFTKTDVPPPNSISPTNVNKLSHIPISRGARSVEERSKESTNATNLSSNVPITTKTEVASPDCISSANANSSSYVPIFGCASRMEEPFKETIKGTNLSSNVPMSTKAEVPSPNSISSTNANSSSHVPISRSASLSSHVPLSHSANSSPLIPISTNAQDVVEEQSHGRILQAN